MKRIILSAVAVTAISGFYLGVLSAQDNRTAGIITKKNNSNKEIIVKYENPKRPFAVGEKFYTLINEKPVAIEVVFPMLTTAKCRLGRGFETIWDQLSVGSVVYAGAADPKNDSFILKKDIAPAGTVKIISGIEMIYIQSGTFMMGSHDSETSAGLSEKPRHKVSLDGFYCAKFEVTQEQYKSVTGKNPSLFQRGGLSPVENISWYDAVIFCNALSLRAGLKPCYIINSTSKDPRNTNSNDKVKSIVRLNSDANGFRLPTEAEWEYACGAASENRFYWGDNENFDSYAIYDKNSLGAGENYGTRIVGSKKPNEWGLYDMCGNVWEWCNDWFDEKYYSSKHVLNPQGAAKGNWRSIRGGSWSSAGTNFRTAYRSWYTADYHDNKIGFRVVLSPK